MATLVVSDLHLGTRTQADLLRRPEIRAVLLERLAGVDRLVLLGDVLELRHGRVRDVLEVGRPFFQEAGEAMGSGEVVIVPGNHDHALLNPWWESRRMDGSGPLGLEQRIEAETGEATARLAQWLGGPELSLAYPGVWLRDDVYAMHGHYVDCHLTVPTFERLAVALMERVVGDADDGGRTPDAYEAPLGPLYAWIHAAAQHPRGGRATAGSSALSARTWRALQGSGRRRLGSRLVAGLAVPTGVAAANRLGLGLFRSDLSGVALRRAGLRAISEVARRLGVEARHLVFGHTHRTGPLPGDDESEWTGPAGMRLANSGSWLYSSHFLDGAPGESPYWPGTCVWVDDDGDTAPRVERLLLDRGHAELRPPPHPV